jgi:hypothetical protein
LSAGFPNLTGRHASGSKAYCRRGKSVPIWPCAGVERQDRTWYASVRATDNDALFVRLPGAPLRSAVGIPEDFCAIAMDARYGLNATLLDFLLGIWRQRDVLTPVEIRVAQ